MKNHVALWVKTLDNGFREYVKVAECGNYDLLAHFAKDYKVETGRELLLVEEEFVNRFEYYTGNTNIWVEWMKGVK